MYPGRATDAAVQAIVESSDSVDLGPYIDSANELVTERCAVVFPGTQQSLDSNNLPIYTPLAGGFTYSSHRLELIERWLAAHFYAVFDPRSEEESVKSVRQKIESKVDLGLDVTRYGQQAMRLDTMGALAVMNNAQKEYAQAPPALAKVSIGVTYLGTPNCRRRIY